MAEDSLKDLERRLNRLENIAWVLGTLAVAFGIGGGSLWGMLNSARKDASELGTKVQTLSSQKEVVETEVKIGIAKVGKATDDSVQKVIGSADIATAKIDGLAQKAVGRRIGEIKRKSFTSRVSDRVGTGPDVVKSKDPRERVLGSYAFCALGSTNMAKGAEVCGCKLSPLSDGPNPSWVLKVNAQSGEAKHCECTAICIDAQ
jgi:uncharacterized protein YjbJ (UPF0337 family)